MANIISQVPNELNLDDYFIKQRSLNSAVYIHKKFLSGRKDRKDKRKKKHSEKLGPTANPQTGNPADKSDELELRANPPNCLNAKDKGKCTTQPEPVLEQTIKFAKSILPITNNSTRVFYSVRTSHRSKDKQAKVKKQNQNVLTDSTRKKTVRDVSTQVNVATNRKDQCITTQRSHETIEELHFNQSLNCSLSDISNRKASVHDSTAIDNIDSNRQKTRRIITPNSFEYLAGVVAKSAGDTKVKILIMDDAEKSMLKEGISAPVVNAIQDCVEKLANRLETNTTVVQKLVASNSTKIDNIFQKLNEMEKAIHEIKFTIKDNKKVKVTDITKGTPRQKPSKVSTLELLGEDLELKEDEVTSEEEATSMDQSIVKKIHVKGTNADIPKISPSVKKEGWNSLDQVEYLGEANEERQGTSRNTSQRSNKIPARFCWTDARH